MTNAEHRRLTHGRLKLLEAAQHAGNVARTCRSSERSRSATEAQGILRRHGMNRLTANQKYRRHTQRWTRYEKAQSGHRLQVDVKFLETSAGSRRSRSTARPQDKICTVWRSTKTCSSTSRNLTGPISRRCSRSTKRKRLIFASGQVPLRSTAEWFCPTSPTVSPARRPILVRWNLVTIHHTMALDRNAKALAITPD